ncbi:MAG: glycosyltransferase family 39 protein [Mycolicibacterium sp.]
MNTLKRINPSIPVLLALMALTAVLRLINIAGSPIRLDDEGTYVAQAFAMIQWGELAHYTYWYDHPPAGWLQLAGWMLLTGPGFGGNAVTAGRYLMVVVAVVGTGLLWLLARRIGMTRPAAAAAVTVLAVSPLAISLSRAVYLDNLAVAWMLAGLVLVCSPRHRLSAMLGAAACFGIAVLTKETMLLFLPMVAWLVWTKTAPATRRYALTVFGTVFALVVSIYALMALVRGELIPGPGHVSLWEGVKFQLWQREASGSIGDPQSLKRHTIDEWLRLDPVLPLLAAPIALSALLIQRLRPYALGLLILVVTVLRPGYLPVPFVIAALPLIALLAAGLGEEGVRRLRRGGQIAPRFGSRIRVTAALATAFAAAMLVALWVPSHDTVLSADDDAAMRQAQSWVAANVPEEDRLIVDDAMWVDLVRGGRDRHNVIWSYKVDTDEQVQNLAPDGWADYGWVVSTPSMRANMPDSGVLTDAMWHARPAATFGSGGERVDVLRVDSGGAPAARPAVPDFGVQVAARLHPDSDPDALADLQSGVVDQRTVATLSMLVSRQPVVLQSISGVAAEEVAGTARREFRLGGPRDQLQAAAGFIERQRSPFGAETVQLSDNGLTVRFPARATDVGLGSRPDPVPAGPPAAVRIVDMRRGQAADRLEFVHVDGTPVGSVRPGTGSPSDYRALPGGTYVMSTVADRGGVPVMRQAFTVAPGATYTLALFSAGETGEIAAQLAPDGPVSGSSVRLLQAAAAAGPVKLALAAPGADPTVLADNASYGLITGYGAEPAGAYDAVVTAGGREWRQPVELTDGTPTTLVVTDGRDGPAVHQTRDVAAAAAPLDPPAPGAPAVAPIPDKNPSKAVAAGGDPRQKVLPLAACATVIAALAWALTRYQRRQGQWRGQW